jgi:hypothetical protein
MPRVPLADFEPPLEKRLDELWGTRPNLYRALANHPALVAAWTEFSRMLRYDTRTPRALRELAEAVTTGHVSDGRNYQPRLK